MEHHTRDSVRRRWPRGEFAILHRNGQLFLDDLRKSNDEVALMEFQTLEQAKAAAHILV